MNIPINEIILGDCMDVMSHFEDNGIPLAITDPPYGIGFDRENESMSCGMRVDGTQRNYNAWSNPTPKKYKKGDWDSSIPENVYFDELKRISKNQIIWGGNYFTEHLPPSGAWVVWDKKVTMTTLSKCELAWCSIGAHIEIYRFLWAGFRKEVHDVRIHPTQKPIQLYRWLLQNYAKPGQLILDTHSGSGSLACACHLEKFDFIAIEKDPDYHRDSVKRLDELRSQGTLF